MSLLLTLAHQALTAVQTRYGLDPNATPLPARQFVSAGQAPWDCELLNVWVVRDFATSGGPEFELLQSIDAHPGHSMRAGVLGIQLVRCYPTGDDLGNPPPVADEEAAAAVVLGDVDHLWGSLWAAAAAGQFSQRNGIVNSGWTSIGPEGGLAGGVLTVNALLPVVG